MAVYHRPELAARLVDMLLRPSSALATPSGMFLAAPRRTGKSTFLVEDLRPALEAEGALVLYVDLWSRIEVDPADLIAGVVSESVGGRRRLMRRLASLASVTSLSVGQVSVSRAEDGPEVGVSVGEALRVLSKDVRRTVVLIVDEAQQAITTGAGTNMLFALKSARDALSRTGEHGLRIVATGSNRDKLAMLRNTKDQAFFGAPLVPFPLLDEDYVRWFVEQQPDPDELDPERINHAFARAGYRPEILDAAAEALRYDLAPPSTSDRSARLVERVEAEIERASAETLRQIRSLTALQSAVLREMAAAGTDYAPFEAATLGAYAARIAAAPNGGPDTPAPTVTNVQGALTRLQERGLVWRAARGVYALEDASVADVLRGAGMLNE